MIKHRTFRHPDGYKAIETTYLGIFKTTAPYRNPPRSEAHQNFIRLQAEGMRDYVILPFAFVVGASLIAALAIIYAQVAKEKNQERSATSQLESITENNR